MPKVFISVNERNQVDSWGSAPITANAAEIELPEGHDFFKNYLAYTYINGTLSKSTELEEEVQNHYNELENKKSADEEIEILKAVSRAIVGESQTADEGRLNLVAQQVNKALQMFAQTLNEEQALEIADLYPEWEPNKAYVPNQIIRYGQNADGESQLYIIIQGHNSQSNWLPKDLPALYKKIGFTPGGIAIWVQPLGATDAYKVGDIVMHKGQKWKSTAAGNVWEPGVYGWVVEP